MHMEMILPTPPDQRVARFLVSAAMMERRQIANAIDGLIAILDAQDGDCDLEPESDMGADDKGEPGSWPEGFSGCAWAIGDDEHEPEDFAQIQRHRGRIRRTRCDKIDHGGRWASWSTWKLRDPTAQAVKAVQPW